MNLITRVRSAPGRTLDLALLATLGLLVVLLAMAGVAAARERGQLRRVTEAYTRATGERPAPAAPGTGRPSEEVQRIQQRGVMAPPPQEPQLTGVLGDLAIFDGGMTVKVGQPVGKMKLVTIGPDWVEVEAEGQKRKLHVFGRGLPGAGSGMPGMRPGGPGAMPPGMPAALPPGMPPGGMPPGMSLTPELMQRLGEVQAAAAAAARAQAEALKAQKQAGAAAEASTPASEDAAPRTNPPR